MELDLNNIIGCMCELKTMENDFLGIGRISAYISEANSLEIVSCDGSKMPSMGYGTKVKVSVLGSKYGFLALEAYVYIAHNSFWRLYDVCSLGENERRNYFRIKTRSHAEVEEMTVETQSGNKGGTSEDGKVKFPCLVLSVSISGALLAIDDMNCAFQLGTVIQINNFTIGEGSQLFTIKCTVRRIEDNERLGKLFGCEFIDLNNKEAQRLCQEIFTQQRIEINRKKGFH